MSLLDYSALVTILEREERTLLPSLPKGRAWHRISLPHVSLLEPILMIKLLPNAVRCFPLLPEASKRPLTVTIFGSVQVFEMDKKLLQVHAMSYIAAYTWEKGTLMRALDMDEFLPPRTGGVPEEELRLRARRLPRRQQRKMR